MSDERKTCSHCGYPISANSSDCDTHCVARVKPAAFEVCYRRAWERVTAERDEARAAIADAAFNCPSCGRHDFGMLAPTIKEACGPCRAALADRDRQLAEARGLLAMATRFNFDDGYISASSSAKGEWHVHAGSDCERIGESRLCAHFPTLDEALGALAAYRASQGGDAK